MKTLTVNPFLEKEETLSGKYLAKAIFFSEESGMDKDLIISKLKIDSKQYMEAIATEDYRSQKELSLAITSLQNEEKRITRVFKEGGLAESSIIAAEMIVDRTIHVLSNVNDEASLEDLPLLSDAAKIVDHVKSLMTPIRKVQSNANALNIQINNTLNMSQEKEREYVTTGNKRLDHLMIKMTDEQKGEFLNKISSAMRWAENIVGEVELDGEDAILVD